MYAEGDMKDRRIILKSKEELLSKARKRLYEIAMINNDTIQSNNLRKMADSTYKRMDNDLELKAIVSSFTGNILSNGYLSINNEKILFDFPINFSKEKVLGVVLYTATVGNISKSHDNDIMFDTFSDMWATAFLDVFIKDIKNDFDKKWEKKKLYLTNSFGPGYYGMDITVSKFINETLQAEDINISVKDSGLINPSKSSCGFNFIMTEPYELNRACDQCMGNKNGCKYCNNEV